MNTHRRYIISFLLLCTTLFAVAQQPSFSLVPPRNVVEGRNFRLTFRLSDGEANPPAAPELAGCSLLYGPATSTMSSTQIVNGKMTSTYSVDYSFTYHADRAGEVTVPAVAVTCQGKTLQSRPATFRILPPDKNSNPQGDSSPQPQGGNGQDNVAPISPDDLLVRVFFSKNTVYEQEPVVATIKVYTKYDISSFLPTTQPAFEGFLTEELPVSLETTMEHYNGQNYHTAVLKRLLLYPQKSGTLSVNSGKYDVTIVQYERVNMGFFGTSSRPIERSITTTSNAATLTVKPLPQPQPEGFAGAVGTFSVSTSLEPELIRTNEAAVYSYTVKGTGNIKFLSSPDVKFPNGVDAYTPKNDINTSISMGGTNMSGTFKTDFTLVPQEVGNFEIQGTPFVFFDLESSSYKTIDVPSTPLKVLRGNGASPVKPQKEIETDIADILHIHKVNEAELKAESSYIFSAPLYWFLYALATVMLILLIIVYRRNLRIKADVTGRKLAKAARVASKRLKESKKELSEHQNDKFYQTLSKALWGYLGDKLSIPASQLTRDNISEKLSAYGLNQTDIMQIVDVLDCCEMARFTPNTSDSEAEEIYTKAENAIKSIEDSKK